MKRKLSILSEEYCKAKKLPILDMPDLSNVTCKSELNLICLKEQNKNLAVALEQNKLKQAEQAKTIDEYESINLKLSSVSIELKNTLLTLAENLSSFLKEHYQDEDNISHIKKVDSLISSVNCNSNETTKTDIETLKNILFELIKKLFSQLTSHESNGVSNKNGFFNVDVCHYQQQIKTLEDHVRSSNNKYNSSKLEVDETLQYTDIIRHKIYMMHDRYEEKLEDLDQATNKLNKERAELLGSVQTQVLSPLGLSNEQSIENKPANGCNTTSNSNSVTSLAELSAQLNDKSSKLDQLQSNFDEIQQKYNELNHTYQNLKITHQLLSDTPLAAAPEHKILLEKNKVLTDDNYQLREYLEFFWDILSEIRSVIKENAAKFQESISSHIGLMIENIKELEIERDNLRNQGLKDSLLKQRCQDEIKHLNGNLSDLTEINETLKNQNSFYSSQLRKQNSDLKVSEEVCELDDDSMDNLTLEEAKSSLKQQNLLIKKLKAEQETFIAEMEITAQSYEDTYDQNSSLMDKLKEKQNSNLRLSSDLFKCNQSIQLLNSRLANCEQTSHYIDLLERQSNDLTERLNQITSLRNKLENSLNGETFKKNVDPSIDSLNEQLTLKQYQLDVSETKLTKTISDNSCLKIDLDNSNRTIENLKSNMELLQKQLEEKTTSLESLVNSQSTTNSIDFTPDAILNEQIRMYKSKLTCACCNSNPINAIIYKCFHLFCHDCLQVRYDTRQRKCPNCNMTFGLNDFHKVYF